jgi:hypothetical protein
VLPEVRNREEYDVGILGPQRVVTKPKASQMSRLKAFDNDVGSARQLEQKGFARRLSYVERDSALVGVQREKRGAAVRMRLVIDERRLKARSVSHDWRFHLDGVGALIRQQLGAKGAGWSVRQLQHF